MFDLTKLPDKYTFNQESLSENKYIDDTSLFLYQMISKGLFDYNTMKPSQQGIAFLYLHPFEWNSKDFVAFLIYVSKEYGLEIKDIKTMVSAFEEEYEVDLDENPERIPEHKKLIADALLKHDKTSYFIEPKLYEGSYEWFLKQKKKGKKTEAVELLIKLEKGEATALDLERALIYADRIVPYGTKNTEYFTKDMFSQMLAYTSFSIISPPEQKNKLVSDIEEYMQSFISDKLIRSNEVKRIRNTSVSQSKNIFTYKKHDALFKEYLQKMYTDFGNIVTIENIFEDKFPNQDDIDTENIRKRFSNRSFLFMHILFAYKKQDLIKILSVAGDWGEFYGNDEVIYQAKIEILPKFINKDLSKELHFDDEKRLLHFMGENISISKKEESDTHKLMRTIFTDTSKVWANDEILEDWGYSFDEEVSKNKVYQAGKAVNAIIAQETRIKDFLVVTTKNISINKKYLQI